MNRGLAIVLCLAPAAIALAAVPARAQMGGASQCTQFPALSQATQVKANAVQAAMKSKADRKDLCRLMTAFVAAEDKVVKFLTDNRTWCGVPDQAVTAAKTNHEKSIKFRDNVCTAAPGPKAPTLSDAIKSTPADSASNTNTKAGRGGTFDTLTGNPLGR